MHLLYDGTSLIDGKPILVLATGFNRPSANKKTGPMIQTFILRKDISPVDACKLGEDVSVCGDCKMRNGSCYVLVFQAPQNVWRSYNNNTPKLFEDLKALGKNRIIRIGSYGDPAAVPVKIWQQFVSKSRAYTGYTHQWKNCTPELNNICMASVDNVAEMKQANNLGWKTFRIKIEANSELEHSEIICKAERDELATCMTCTLCDGNKVNVAVTLHGSKVKINKFKSMQTS